jgi:hypothetical protein
MPSTEEERALPVVQVGQLINIEWKDEDTGLRSDRVGEITGVRKKSKFSKSKKARKTGGRRRHVRSCKK